MAEADAALAAQLQAEEQQLALAEAQHAAFTTAMQRDLQKALSCEDPAAQAAALEVMPLARLREDARATCALNAQLGEGAQLGELDVLVQSLALWFKSSFMTWVGSSLPCGSCGGIADSQSRIEPLPEERAEGASRVEGFECATCGALARFPRYTDPKKLLTTRRGRCGEWSHTFLLMLRSAGLDARHVHDHADHVWVEYYSEHLGRWVHVDPCEAAFDTPLLYGKGWGKKLALVVAVGALGAADVTRRYVADYAAAQKRRRRSPELALVSDEFVAAQITALNQRLRAQIPQDRRNTLIIRDLAEGMQLQMPSLGKRSQGAQQQLPGRQSGPAEWRAARGEAGAAAAAAASRTTNGVPPPPPAGTRYDLSGTGAVPLAQLYEVAGRLFSFPGGACRASGQNGQGEGCVRLFDGAVGTKWLDFGGGGVGAQAWVEWRLPAAAAPAAVAHYCLVSGNDEPARDPAHVLLECVPASSDAQIADHHHHPRQQEHQQQQGQHQQQEDGEWVVVDERTGVKFAARGQLLSFTVPDGAQKASRRWRLRVLATADPKAANSVQLAVWDAYVHDHWSPETQQALRAMVGSATTANGTGAAGGASDSESADAAAGSESVPGAAGAGEAVRGESAAGTASGDEKGTAKAGRGGSADDEAAIDLLRRVAGNLLADPVNEKCFHLRGDKVASMLQQPACCRALLAMGFRPLLVPPRAGLGPQQQPGLVGNALACVGLVADHSDGKDNASDGRQAVRRAAAAVLDVLGS